MKKLRDILYKVQLIEIIGNAEIEIEGLAFDSRKLMPAFAYVAQKGTLVDGHNFIDSAIEKGAKAIVVEDLPESLSNDVVYIRVKDSSEALAVMAANFHDNPSTKLKLVGVTGTNGKTTTATLLFNLFTKLGYKCGLFSTVVNRIGEDIIKSTHTTPDALQLNELLQRMLDECCTHCFMEVSSHAIVQNRVKGLQFAGGVFTNITHDHLDYHKTFKDYLIAKRQFFNQLSPSAFALANKDDKNANVMLQESVAKKYFYALKSGADFQGKIIESTFLGLNLKIDGQEMWSQLIGNFNAYNLLAAYGVARLLGEDKMQTLVGLSSLEAVAGRFQYININGIAGIVDYAHTPDALQNVLDSIKEIRNGNEEVITVVGCGGDRDKEKRPLMAEIACKMSNRVILTSDNPRTEDPEKILEDMKKGVDPSSRRKVLSITDRKEAIRTACSLAKSGDILLVAGKGHENYQEINGKRQDFDDMKILTKALNEYTTN